jgi:hypothetical protein
VFISEPISLRAQFSVSRNGVLVWRSGHVDLAQLTWLDRTGKTLGATGPPCLPDIVSLSQDEKRVLLYTLVDHAGFVIAEAGRNGFIPLAGVTSEPLWMPRPSRILYPRAKGNSVQLITRFVEGGAEKVMAQVPELSRLLDISPDSKFALYHSGQNLNCIRLDDPNAAPQTIAHSANSKFSPDGRWIVYTQQHEGNTDQPQLYVRQFPGGGLPTQITSEGGRGPVWRGDGKEILYRFASTIYSVRVQVQNNALGFSPPEALFNVRVPIGVVGDSQLLAVNRDGSKILFAQAREDSGPRDTYVMTAWDTALRH